MIGMIKFYFEINQIFISLGAQVCVSFVINNK